MRGCKLRQVVAERNNQLGRLADPITMLFFDLRFIALAPDCITTLRSEDPQTADLLSEALASKLTKRNAHMEQAVLLSDEMMTFWEALNLHTDYASKYFVRGYGAQFFVSQQMIQLKQGELLEVSTIYDSLQPLNSSLGESSWAAGYRCPNICRRPNIISINFSREDRFVSMSSPMPEQTGSRPGDATLRNVCST